MLPPLGAIIGGAIVIGILFVGWLGLKVLGFIFIDIPWIIFKAVTEVFPMLLLGIGLEGGLEDQIFHNGAYFAIFLQLIPFLLVYWVVSRFKPSRTTKGTTVLILVALYIASNLYTGIFAAAASEIMFRQTELGKAFPKKPRKKLLECQKLLRSGEMAFGKPQELKMTYCKDAVPEANVDQWCNSFFALKKPFTDIGVRYMCAKRSGRLANVEPWPIAPSARGPFGE